MNFRDATQRARACRALLTCGMDGQKAAEFWTERGPTALALKEFWCQFGPGNLSLAERTALSVAWSVWNESTLSANWLSAAMRDWKSDGWRVFANFATVMSVAPPFDQDALNEWLIAVERRHGWST